MPEAGWRWSSGRLVATLWNQSAELGKGVTDMGEGKHEKPPPNADQPAPRPQGPPGDTDGQTDALKPGKGDHRK